MSDVVDKANDLAQTLNDTALNAALTQGAKEPPQLKDKTGQVICLECAEPVPLARLAILPNTPWCVECKQLGVRNGN